MQHTPQQSQTLASPADSQQNAGNAGVSVTHCIGPCQPVHAMKTVGHRSLPTSVGFAAHARAHSCAASAACRSGAPSTGQRRQARRRKQPLQFGSFHLECKAVPAPVSQLKHTRTASCSVPQPKPFTRTQLCSLQAGTAETVHKHGHLSCAIHTLHF